MIRAGLNTLFIFFITFLSSNSLVANDILISAKVKKPVYEVLLKDLAFLAQMRSLDNVDPNLLQALNIRKESSLDLDHWIKQRVRFIVEEDFLSAKNIYIFRILKVIESEVNYPNQHLTPYSYDPRVTNQESNIVTVMSNLGASIYLMGKIERSKYRIKFNQKGSSRNILIPLVSPRVGIIQIGQGLFEKNLSINRTYVDAISNRLQRITTFFHEARHSDGNGRSLSFGHIKCPVGHFLEDKLACDENLNGPYTLGGLLALEMVKFCGEDCTIAEKNTFKALALDNLSRVIKIGANGEKSKHWDSRPEHLAD